MSDEVRYQMPERSRLERVLGGRPGAVAVRLLLVSLVVGFLMTLFGVNVHDVVSGAIAMVEDALRDGSGVFRNMLGYVVTGAALVIPVWIVLRLVKMRP